MTVYVAAPRLFQLYGIARSTRVHHGHLSHDLSMSAVFLHFWSRWPRLTARCWVGETVLSAARAAGGKIEDALLVHRRTRRPLLAVEHLGRYRKDVLAAKHQDFVARGLPYVGY